MSVEISRRLLTWFAANGRDLPWRHERTPYRVAVAEFMLQQTQVRQVIPYYQRWLQRFPSWVTLAVAPLDDVLKLWEGLGYYSRARRLHQLAQIVVADYGGQLPSQEKTLLALPGIGRYTAGAILSLAFGQDMPLLDGNVRRVLARLYAWGGDPNSREGERWLWAQSRALLPSGQAGAMNEALMDLGAMICTPRGPRCDLCPLAAYCLAFTSGRPEAFPSSSLKPPLPHHQIVAAVWQDTAGRFLLAKRPLPGLLASLWEFPSIDCGAEPAYPPDACLQKWLATEMGWGRTLIGAALPPLRHAYTHFRLTLYPFYVSLPAKTDMLNSLLKTYPAWRWATPTQARQGLAMTGVSGRLLAQLVREGSI